MSGVDVRVHRLMAGRTDAKIGSWPKRAKRGWLPNFDWLISEDHFFFFETFSQGRNGGRNTFFLAFFLSISGHF